MTELRARAVEKHYGDLQILKGVDLDVEDGEFVVLVGPSGCGKTTLLNIIAGLDQASSGTIEIDGNVVNKVSPANRNIAMVFQSYALYPTMTVRKNITFGMECRGVAKPDREAATNRVAELLQITHLLDRKPSQLSGGQRQRVAMGRALVREPSLFLFDEPLSNLDAKLRVEMRAEIKKLHAKMGTTSIYVTHDQVEAMTLASRIAIMNRGQIEQFCTPKEMYDQPASLFVARFMGAPPMNTLPARVSNASGDLQILIGEGPSSQALTLSGAKESVRPWIDREIVIGIRPECISDVSEGQSGLPGRSVLQADVELTEPTGAETLVTLRVGKSEFLACVSPDVELESGQKASFAVDMRRACLFDPTTERRIG